MNGPGAPSSAGRAGDPPSYVRDLDPDDLPEILRIEHRCFPDPWSLQAFISELQRPRTHLRVVESAGAVAAYLIGWFVSDEAHIANVAVSPDHQGRGLGSLLLEEFIDMSYREGASYIVLEVRVGNEPAIHLYEKYNFRRVAVRKNYYEQTNEDAYVMIRHLVEEEESDGFE